MPYPWSSSLIWFLTVAPTFLSTIEASKCYLFAKNKHRCNTNCVHPWIFTKTPWLWGSLGKLSPLQNASCLPSVLVHHAPYHTQVQSCPHTEPCFVAIAIIDVVDTRFYRNFFCRSTAACHIAMPFCWAKLLILSVLQKAPTWPNPLLCAPSASKQLYCSRINTHLCKSVYVSAFS